MTSMALKASDVTIQTSSGRTLIQGLNLQMAATDKVAIVGRNGVGKSTLLRVLADEANPSRGHVAGSLSRVYVSQHAASVEGASPGEGQRSRLAQAFASHAGVLLLDEPTHDLDSAGVHWLVGEVQRWDGALLAVSHNRQLLRCFSDFFIVREAGCRYFQGTFDELLVSLETQAHDEQERYVRSLERLLEKEEHNATIRRRRQRKKNLGRIRELGRGTSRMELNANRSFAQESQGKRDGLRKQRIEQARAWTLAARRALSVELSFEVALPKLAKRHQVPAIELKQVSACVNERHLFSGVDIAVHCSDAKTTRLAVVGPNGAGKSTLLQIACGDRQADEGQVTLDDERTGYIAQNAANWNDARSVVECLLEMGYALEPIAMTLQTHKFPLALAERPLAELSPGERLRAALICLMNQAPPPEVLVLDEPTDHLDFVGLGALEDTLQRWPGALLVVSHDEEFLANIRIDQRLDLSKNAIVRDQLSVTDQR